MSKYSFIRIEVTVPKECDFEDADIEAEAMLLLKDMQEDSPEIPISVKLFDKDSGTMINVE